MKAEHLSLLVCPQTLKPLELKDVVFKDNGHVIKGYLVEATSGIEYPIVNSIPRFVSSENYATSFGYQWKKHIFTQHDSYSKIDISKKRFLDETKWVGDLSDEIILEVGSGSGRFTSHALNTGATVVSFDYSNAVEANYEMNGGHPKLLIVQADIFQMPFLYDFFDKAFCFGVLQHTPDPHRAFTAIIDYLKPGGNIASDIYWKSFRRFLHIKTWLRPFTKNKEPELLYQFVKKYVDVIWPLVIFMKKTVIGQKFVSRFVADRSDYMHGANDSMLKEWAYLDTFDWLSPAFDQPQTLKEFRLWHTRADLLEIEVHRGYNGLEGRGTKQ